MKVLIADDSKVMRMMVGKSLQQAGFTCEIVEAVDGADGVAKFDDSIELVLSDWNMPNMNGLDLVKAIRQKNTTVPIVMITTEGSEDKIGEAIQSGANGYVCKPFTPEKIKEQITTVLKK